jgi:hypothetical protein
LCPGDRLGAPLHVEFAVDVRDMFLDGGHADDQVTGDLIVGQPLYNEVEDFELAPGEGFRQCAVGRLGMGINTSRRCSSGTSAIKSGAGEITQVQARTCRL